MDAIENSLTPRERVKRANQAITQLLAWLQETPRRLEAEKDPLELSGLDEIEKRRQDYIWVVARAADLLTTGNIVEACGKVANSWHSLVLAICLSYLDQLIAWCKGKSEKPSDPLVDEISEKRLIVGVTGEYGAAMTKLPAEPATRVHPTTSKTLESVKQPVSNHWKKKATVNDRMLGTIQRDPQSVNWTQRQWAEHLGCCASAVATAPAWGAVKAARAMAAVERLQPPKKRAQDYKK
jgi:hypothetical protein